MTYTVSCGTLNPTQLNSSLISTSNWFFSVLWHCWFGHLACKHCPRNDLLCVEWDVKPCILTHSSHQWHLQEHPVRIALVLQQISLLQVGRCKSSNNWVHKHHTPHHGVYEGEGVSFCCDYVVHYQPVLSETVHQRTLAMFECVLKMLPNVGSFHESINVLL